MTEKTNGSSTIGNIIGPTLTLSAGLALMFTTFHQSKIADSAAPFENYRYVKTRIMPTLDSCGYVTVPAGYIDGSEAPFFNGPQYQYVHSKDQEIHKTRSVRNNGKLGSGTHKEDYIAAYRVNAQEFAPIMAHPLSEPQRPPFFTAYPNPNNLDEWKGKGQRLYAELKNLLR